VDLVSQQEQRAGDLGRVGELVRLFLAQHVPDRHQELPGHGHHRLGASQVLEAFLVVIDPMRVVADCLVGGIHHGTPKVAPASLGDSRSC